MEKLANRLLRSVPINKQTALVISKGVRFEPNKKIVQRHWRSIPPECRKFKGPKDQNLAGLKVGRFTVVRYYGSGKEGALWLARCACGDYETRYARSVKNPSNKGDRCEKCRAVLFLQQRQLRDGPGRISNKRISEFN